jgi:hypothetical protein
MTHPASAHRARRELPGSAASPNSAVSSASTGASAITWVALSTKRGDAASSAQSAARRRGERLTRRTSHPRLRLHATAYTRYGASGRSGPSSAPTA